MKTYNEILNESSSFELDETTTDDSEIIKYLGSKKILIIRDISSKLKSKLKVKTKVTPDKLFGTIENIKTIFNNFKIATDNHFYYFNSKDKSKVQKLIK